MLATLIASLLVALTTSIPCHPRHQLPLWPVGSIAADSVLSSQSSVLPRSPQPPDDLLTVAERSGYKATARYDDVVALADRLAARSMLIHRSDIGKTHEGRSIPLLIVADPPISSPEEARKSGKLVVLLFGNIHAGEVCGKEALMMLARELALADDKPPLLKDLILALVPIYNADGNEQVSKDNRPGQVGPEEGMGIRANAQGLDLNRDYVKLEAPETRALVRFIDEWDPAIVIDTHTTNGSLHRYLITYAGPTNPAGDGKIIEYVRDTYLPSVSKSLDERTGGGVKSFFYGNFEKDHTLWTTYPDEPRYGAPYIGLRNRLSILCEAYAYAPFKDRVEGTLEFCRECLTFAAANKDDIRKLIREADERTQAAGREPKEDDLVALRSEVRPFTDKVKTLGYDELEKAGKRVAGEPREYDCELVNDFVPTLTVRRPFAYLYPASLTAITENLQRHGIDVEELREDIELDVQAYRIDSAARAPRSFQGHEIVDVAATAVPRVEQVKAGTMIVRTAQPLGSLAAYLLEPAAADGLCAWNFFDDSLSIGADFPVLRVPDATTILTAATRPLPERRTMNKRLSYETVYEKEPGPSFSGSPTSVQSWLDKEHFLQTRDGALRNVNSRTGRSERLFDPAPMAAALAKLPTIGDKAAKSLADGAARRLNESRTAAHFDHEGDLYYATIDGTIAVRLTASPAAEESPTFSPDGEFIAFIRDNDLWVVDVATQTERALTQGGTDLVRNGKNDWVYFEELYNRNWRAFWWSPDSKRLAFLQVDSTTVPRFVIPVDHNQSQTVENAPFPKPGQANPLVKLGVVSAAGAGVRWADLSDYDPGHFLITGVGWLPGSAEKDSPAAFCYIQDRTQTWLDMLTVPTGGGQPTRLFRETTDAWVVPLGEPRFLKDGSFLWHSERTGFRHLYHYADDGKLIAPITSGEWEVRSVELVDQDATPSLVYFTGTLDSPIAQNLYRITLTGENLERLTTAAGNHNISVSPDGRAFVDSWSSHQHPTRVMLYSAEGEGERPVLRTLDANPVYSMEEYQRGEFELFHIPMDDGFLLEASLLKPPDFDPERKYPVWLMTYAGPHAPTITDSWGGGRVSDEAIAEMGVLVFRVDPRSASGKGACSAWTAYKQLGVQELKDLDEAVTWLSSHPYVDSKRIGISGGSYGGFMTCFALTHSKLFAAGVAVASVTDWRDYDSIYTERYMGLPQDNPDGYDKTSVVKAAKDLHGRLLLVHGTMDDNVHLQNSIRFTRALQEAGKQFEFMVYPGSRHGVGGKHYRRLMFDFLRRSFELPEPGAGTTPEPAGGGDGGGIGGARSIDQPPTASRS